MCRRFDSVSRHISLISGRVAKRLNAADCKSAPSGSGVRIPPLPYLYGHSLKVELRSPKPSVWVQFLLPVFIVNMAGVVKWLTHQIVALACVGSIPITRLFYIIGVQPSGKARDFDSLMRWFESSYPSLTLPAWRNWQTRWTQNPVSARTCRFDPGRRYCLSLEKVLIHKAFFDVFLYRTPNCTPIIVYP